MCLCITRILFGFRGTEGCAEVSYPRDVRDEDLLGGSRVTVYGRKGRLSRVCNGGNLTVDTG